jgi:general secretion pathway protein G
MFGSERRQVNHLSRLRALTAYRHLPAAYSRHARGFTLLELMIVISILVILALIAMGQYNRTVLAAKEATLREDLFTMRKMIDQYAADKGKLPQSLSDLQSAGYLHDIPIDPMTDAADWQVEFGEDPGSTGGEQGVTNVRSASGDTSSDGSTRYSEW